MRLSESTVVSRDLVRLTLPSNHHCLFHNKPRSLLIKGLKAVDLSKSTQARITEWTAMGDSYASGIGAGVRSTTDNDRCYRFTLSYPRIMQSSSFQDIPGKLNHVACSGRTFHKILQQQFLDKSENNYPVWGSAPEFVTITMGGNDIGILGLLTACIFNINPFKSCDTAINDGYKALDSQEFKRGLPQVIFTALRKGHTQFGQNFRVYVTGYAQFFNAETTQCDTVTFTLPSLKSNLTQDKRRKMNQLALALNDALRAAVNTFPAQFVTYIDYDTQYTGHRFCDREEPSPDNPDTWFFHRNTRTDAALQALLNNMTLPDPSMQSDLIAAFDTAAGGGKEKQVAGSDLYRAFHPTPRGQQAIRDLLIEAINKDRAQFSASNPTNTTTGYGGDITDPTDSWRIKFKSVHLMAPVQPAASGLTKFYDSLEIYASSQEAAGAREVHDMLFFMGSLHLRMVGSTTISWPWIKGFGQTMRVAADWGFPTVYILYAANQGPDVIRVILSIA